MAILGERLIDLKDPQFANLLGSLQGNILKSHARNFTKHIFFELRGNTQKNKDAIKEISTLVTSAMKQFEDSETRKNSGVEDLPFRGLYLTAKGYAKLGFSESKLNAAFPEPRGPIAIGNQITFKSGMAFHQDELNDPDTQHWEQGYATSSPNKSQRQLIDGMLLLANDKVSVLLNDLDLLLQVLNANSVSVLRIETGKSIFNENKDHIEHFGYVDGRSQPIFIDTDMVAENNLDGTDRWDPSEALGLVLVPDTLSNSNESFGSYFVFRKLEQNVKGFKDRENALADTLGLGGDQKALAGAYAVGRFRDGTPVVLQSTDGNTAPVQNNFRFDDEDVGGRKCPFHAHIRKMSPRGDSAPDQSERTHRIARRGITYDERSEAEIQSGEDPTGKVGLLFMCFQSNIDNQFGFMQRAWANNTEFARPNAGLDPTIGQSSLASPQHWPNSWNGPGDTTFSFDGFVKMLGGEFFFAPSITFFQSL